MVLQCLRDCVPPAGVEVGLLLVVLNELPQQLLVPGDRLNAAAHDWLFSFDVTGAGLMEGLSRLATGFTTPARSGSGGSQPPAGTAGDLASWSELAGRIARLVVLLDQSRALDPGAVDASREPLALLVRELLTPLGYLYSRAYLPQGLPERALLALSALIDSTPHMTGTAVRGALILVLSQAAEELSAFAGHALKALVAAAGSPHVPESVTQLADLAARSLASSCVFLPAGSAGRDRMARELTEFLGGITGLAGVALSRASPVVRAAVLRVTAVALRSLGSAGVALPADRVLEMAQILGSPEGASRQEAGQLQEAKWHMVDLLVTGTDALKGLSTEASAGLLAQALDALALADESQLHTMLHLIRPLFLLAISDASALGTATAILGLDGVDKGGAAAAVVAAVSQACLNAFWDAKARPLPTLVLLVDTLLLPEALRAMHGTFGPGDSALVVRAASPAVRSAVSLFRLGEKSARVARLAALRLCRSLLALPHLVPVFLPELLQLARYSPPQWNGDIELEARYESGPLLIVWAGPSASPQETRSCAPLFPVPSGRGSAGGAPRDGRTGPDGHRPVCGVGHRAPGRLYLLCGRLAGSSELGRWGPSRGCGRWGTTPLGRAICRSHGGRGHDGEETDACLAASSLPGSQPRVPASFLPTLYCSTGELPLGLDPASPKDPHLAGPRLPEQICTGL